MANENPSPATRFKESFEDLAEKPVCVRLPKNVDAIVRAKPDKNDWLRKVITEAANAEISD